tara:strand:+ start:1583 stop:1780 length:198 start_codon:yes stop_codon:yes gene_type:complete
MYLTKENKAKLLAIVSKVISDTTESVSYEISMNDFFQRGKKCGVTELATEIICAIAEIEVTTGDE